MGGKGDRNDRKKKREDDGKLQEHFLNKQWLPLFQGFQWRPVLSTYCLKVRLMDDYLMGKFYLLTEYSQLKMIRKNKTACHFNFTRNF